MTSNEHPERNGVPVPTERQEGYDHFRRLRKLGIIDEDGTTTFGPQHSVEDLHGVGAALKWLEERRAKQRGTPLPDLNPDPNGVRTFTYTGGGKISLASDSKNPRGAFGEDERPPQIS